MDKKIKKIQSGYAIGQWLGEIFLAWIGIALIILIFTIPLLIIGV